MSVEISADGVNMLPLSTPVITSGLTYIKIQLVKAEVASAVCLRLHRPRDASTLGLSQIKLLGLTAFGNTSSATVNNPFLPSEDQVSKTRYGFFCIINHCKLLDVFLVFFTRFMKLFACKAAVSAINLIYQDCQQQLHIVNFNLTGLHFNFSWEHGKPQTKDLYLEGGKSLSPL